MLKFFKKTRRKLVLENATFKFLRYAFVEIILVVIGILIAVQINNWNENNKNRKIEIDLLRGLLEDTKTDSVFFNSRVLHLTNYINNVNKLNAIYNGNKTPAVLNTPFNNYRIFDIGMAYQSTVILNNSDKIEEFTDGSVKDLLRSYILQHNYVSIAFGQKDKFFDKYAGDLLLKYSDLSFALKDSTTLKNYYQIIEYPKNIKVVNFLKASVLNSRIQTNNLIKLNYQLQKAIENALIDA